MPPDADSGARPYAARLGLPFAVIGVRIEAGLIAGLDLLPPDAPLLPAGDALSRRLEAELQAYLRDPRHPFGLPLQAAGTPFRRRVWAAACAIPAGETRTYGALARQLHTGARAVGQALGDNPLPILIPCHRVVAAGGLGGFDHRGAGFSLEIKRWLLRHEGVRSEE